MGTKLRVISKQREYGNLATLNHKHLLFKTLLCALDAEVFFMNENENEFECTVEDYQNAIDNLKKFKITKSHYNNKLETDVTNSINITIKELGYTIDELINIMEIYFSQRDMNSDYIQFECY